MNRVNINIKSFANLMGSTFTLQNSSKHYGRWPITLMKGNDKGGSHKNYSKEAQIQTEQRTLAELYLPVLLVLAQGVPQKEQHATLLFDPAPQKNSLNKETNSSWISQLKQNIRKLNS